MKIVVFGAGSIGCYVGGRLLANGEQVVLYGRDKLKAIITEHGLTLTHYELDTEYVAASKINYVTELSCLANADLILICVKSQDTPQAITDIKQHAKKSAVVASLQNGVHNPGLLKQGLPEFTTAGGMVPFNVTNKGEGHFHCGTEGYLIFEKNFETGLLSEKCNAAGIEARLSENINGVLWSKLLLNLNNALNLLSDLPLKQELAQRDYRRVLAMCIDEGIAILDAANIQLEQIGKAPIRHLPKILRLPNIVFQTIAKGMLKIDPLARSSMWEDLNAKRNPEIDYLNGALVNLADQHGMLAPINRHIVAMVKQAFTNGQSPGLSGSELLAELDALM
jgi:2-dehydropantoate 2-reductase